MTPASHVDLTRPVVHRCIPLAAPVDATVTVPGSKSIANRALVCAALADGVSRLTGLPDGDDTVAMLDALGRLGAVDRGDASAVTVHGSRRRWPSKPLTLDAMLAGTTSRFLTAMCALSPVPITIDGGAPLRRRPMAALQDALAALGTHVARAGSGGDLPVTVHGLRAGGTVRLPGDISSQFVSALMMIGPCLEGGLHIELTSPLVSRPYVEMTVAVMAAFGATGVAVAASSVTIPQGEYRPCSFQVEPDASSASYPLAAAAVTGGRVTVPGLTAASIQGDARFVEILGRMGAATGTAPDGLSVRGEVTHGVDVDMADISDLVPTLAAVAMFAHSPTRIRGVGFIRAKESDRLGDLATELCKLGGDVQATPDGLLINPAPLHGARLATHHDHRLAMAFGLIGLRVPGVEIEEPGVVAKSWPAYWTMLEHLR